MLLCHVCERECQIPRSKRTDTLLPHTRLFRSTRNAELKPWRKALIGLRWLLFKDGLGATNHFESCAFLRSAAGVEWPDVQYHFRPGAMRYDGNAAFDGQIGRAHV